jgi:hypothetical protein
MTEDQIERAAIMEYDGRLPRATADYLARRPASWWEGKTREELSTAAVARMAEMSRKPEARKVSGSFVVGHVGTRK